MDDLTLFRCLTGQSNRDEATAVATWRQASAANEQRYRELDGLLRAAAADHAARPVGSPPAVSDIVNHAVARMPSRALAATAVTSRHRLLWPTLASAAAVLIAVSLYLGLRASQPTPVALGVDQVVTNASESATVELLDGTVVRLAPRSRLEVVPMAGERVVALEGRAYFAVAKMKESLFRIRTQAGEVTVTGTRFDLEAQSRNLRLIVVEGHVILASRQTKTAVTAGEMARVVAGAQAPVVRVAEVAPLVEWVGPFMAFQDTPLAEAAQEIEKRFGVRVHFTDSTLAHRTVSAWFTDQRLAGVMDVVCVVTSVRCSIHDRVVTISPHERDER
jgi:ferric-dicitrate binding protein FerR (iron transport regulator)